MTDYGHPITFGLSLDPSADRLEETRQLAHSRGRERAGSQPLLAQPLPGK
jgi:hypothetical protein